MSNAIDLIIVPGFLVAGFLLVLLGLSFHVAGQRLKASRAQIRQSAAWQQAYRQLLDACDQVIVELESHPATYETFPSDVRGAVYAAHDSACQLEGK